MKFHSLPFSCAMALVLDARSGSANAGVDPSPQDVNAALGTTAKVMSDLTSALIPQPEQVGAFFQSLGAADGSSKAELPAECKNLSTTMSLGVFALSMEATPPAFDKACPLLPTINPCLLKLTPDMIRDSFDKDLSAGIDSLNMTGVVALLNAGCTEVQGPNQYCAAEAYMWRTALSQNIGAGDFNTVCKVLPQVTPCFEGLISAMDGVVPFLAPTFASMLHVMDTGCQKDGDTGDYCFGSMPQMAAQQCGMQQPDSDGKCPKGCQVTNDGDQCMHPYTEFVVAKTCSFCNSKVLAALQNFVGTLDDNRKVHKSMIQKLNMTMDVAEAAYLTAAIYYSSRAAHDGICAVDRPSQEMCYAKVKMFSSPNPTDVSGMNTFLFDATHGSPLPAPQALHRQICAPANRRCMTRMTLGLMDGEKLKVDPIYSECRQNFQSSNSNVSEDMRKMMIAECEKFYVLGHFKSQSYSKTSAFMCSAPDASKPHDTCLGALSVVEAKHPGFHTCVNAVFSGEKRTDPCLAALNLGIPMLGCCAKSLVSDPLASLASMMSATVHGSDKALFQNNSHAMKLDAHAVAQIQGLVKGVAGCTLSLGQKLVKKTLPLHMSCAKLANAKGKVKTLNDYLQRLLAMDLAANLGVSTHHMKVAVPHCADDKLEVTVALQTWNDATTDSVSSEFDALTAQTARFPLPLLSSELSQYGVVTYGDNAASAPGSAPTPVPSPHGKHAQPSHHHTHSSANTGIIVASIVGGLAVVLLAAGAAVFFLRKREVDHEVVEVAEGAEMSLYASAAAAGVRD